MQLWSVKVLEETLGKRDRRTGSLSGFEKALILTPVTERRRFRIRDAAGGWEQIQTHVLCVLMISFSQLLTPWLLVSWGPKSAFQSCWNRETMCCLVKGRFWLMAACDTQMITPCQSRSASVDPSSGLSLKCFSIPFPSLLCCRFPSLLLSK